MKWWVNSKWRSSMSAVIQVTKNAVASFTPVAKKAIEYQTVEELFNTAMGYGKVHVHTFEGGANPRLCADIKFECKPGMSLEAKSGNDHKTLKSALIKAIKNAQEITAQFK